MTVPLSHGDRKLAVGLKISNSLELLTAHDDMGGLLLLPLTSKILAQHRYKHYSSIPLDQPRHLLAANATGTMQDELSLFDFSG